MSDPGASRSLVRAMTDFMADALALYKSCYGVPQITDYPFPGRYQRHGQEIFGPARERTWVKGHDPSCFWTAVSSRPSYQGLLEALEAVPWVAKHFRELVGSVMSAGRIDLRVVLERDLLDRIVVTSNSFDVPRGVLAETAEGLVTFLFEEQIEHLSLVPVLGYESSMTDVELHDGWHLRLLGDDELALLLAMNALPVIVGSFGYVTLPRSWQWAAVKTTLLPKIFGSEREESAGCI